MFDFFIDTADTDYIEALWKRLGNKIDPKCMRGITTNPSAFHKMGEHSFQEWMAKSTKLAKIIQNIRNDYLGELHIQYPHSTFTQKEFRYFVDLLSIQMPDNVKVVIKIPPFPEMMKVAEWNHRDLNVTGVADAATALMALNHNTHYVSIIPGRMEEHGLDAKAHVAYVQQATLSSERYFRQNVITGSMRTLECLKWCVGYGTIPTIGTRVWDLINDTNIDEICSYSKGCVPMMPTKFGPRNSEEHSDLSIAFFQEMDQKGALCYVDVKPPTMNIL